MDDFERRMATLKRRFVDRAAADAAALQAAWVVRDSKTATEIAHSLAGGAGIFGYHELSEAARELEAAIEQSAPDRQIRIRLKAVLAQIPTESTK